MQSCLNCSFLQTKYPFADDAISRLYSDYRSDSYNRERIFYEPDYANYAVLVGPYTEGNLERIPALTAWIRRHLDLTGASMLDYGGADGKYLPAFDGSKFVYEISDIAPEAGVTRISSAAHLESYDYVQLSHVLEHVTHPLLMVREVAKTVRAGGHLLIEVPQDLASNLIADIQRGASSDTLSIHEHINQYSVAAVAALVQAAGLEVVALEPIPVKTPWSSQDFIRCLAQRSPAAS